MGLYWVINMGVPVLIGVCQQASSGGGGGSITFSINSVGYTNTQPATSPAGQSNSVADAGNSFTYPVATDAPPTGLANTISVGGGPFEPAFYSCRIRYDSTPFDGSQGLFSTGKVLQGAASGPNAGICLKVSFEFNVEGTSDPETVGSLIQDIWWAEDQIAGGLIPQLTATPTKIEFIYSNTSNVVTSTAFPSGGGFVDVAFGDASNNFAEGQIAYTTDGGTTNTFPAAVLFKGGEIGFDSEFFGVSNLPQTVTLTFIAIDGTESTTTATVNWVAGPDAFFGRSVIQELIFP